MSALAAIVLFAYAVEHTNPSDANSPVLHWSPASAPYAVNEACSKDIADKTGCYAAVATSFDQWNGVSNFHYHTDCLTTRDYHTISPSGSQGGEQTDGNSIVTWLNSGWPDSAGTNAITFNWFDPNTGVIGESDMIANGQDYTWTIGDSNVQTDVQNFLTHEAGHYLGMAHSADTEATMYFSGTQGETKKRDLNADDIAGVQSIYGAGNTGLSGTPQQCSTAAKPSCTCSTAPSTRGTRAGVLGSLAAAFVAIAAMLRRRRALAGGIAAAAVLGFAPRANATSMRALSLEELAGDSDAVVLGTVEHVEAVTDGAGIHTVNTVVVHEVLAGPDFGTTLEIVTPGGVLPAGVAGPRGFGGLRVSGAPALAAGDEVVLFAQRTPGGTLVLPDLVQSVFEVRRDVRGGATLHRDLGSVAIYARDPDGALVPAIAPDALDGIHLDDLRSALRSIRLHEGP